MLYGLHSLTEFFYLEDTPVDKDTIINCHSHLFTHENIPNDFFPFFLVPAARITPLRWVLRGIMKMIVPWTKNDKVHRYAAFVKAAYRDRQEENLQKLMRYYPEKTQFIVLPMDMGLMGAGEVIEEIDAQHAELARLHANQQYRDILIPFAHIDPRREDSLVRLTALVEQENFKGVKIYPPFGYAPDHKRLMEEIYPYMVEKNIPLISHCSPSWVKSKKISMEEAHRLADPDNYRKVMDVFPDLRICLAHFGGISEWKKHLNGERNTHNPTWLDKIVALIKYDNYQNLYADISYTIFNFQENAPFLKILLQDEDISPKVLFGSDFYMVESEKYSEKRLSIDLRVTLGEEFFWQIANSNPQKFLYGQGS